MTKCRGLNRYRYGKQAIEQQAEQEGTALRKQGWDRQSKPKHIKLSKDCDSAVKRFNNLFKD